MSFEELYMLYNGSDFCMTCLNGKDVANLISAEPYDKFFNLYLSSENTSTECSLICVWCAHRVSNAIQLLQDTKIAQTHLNNIRNHTLNSDMNTIKEMREKLSHIKGKNCRLKKTNNLILDLNEHPHKLTTFVKDLTSKVYFYTHKSLFETTECEDLKIKIKDEDIVCHIADICSIENTFEMPISHFNDTNQSEYLNIEIPPILQDKTVSSYKRNSVVNEKIDTAKDIARKKRIVDPLNDMNVRTVETELEEIKADVHTKINNYECDQQSIVNVNVKQRHKLINGTKEKSIVELNERKMRKNIQSTKSKEKGYNIIGPILAVQAKIVPERQVYSGPQKTAEELEVEQNIFPVTISEMEREIEHQQKLRLPSFAEAPYKFVPCALAFPFMDTYLAHMNKHDEKLGPYKCSVCEIYTNSASMLSKHSRSHVSRFQCQVCGLRRPSRLAVIRHYTTQHQQIELPCQLCEKKFTNQVSLRCHIVAVHHRATSKYSCTQCSSQLKNKGTLRNHMVRMHGESTVGKQRMFSCTDCDSTFRTKYSLTLHGVVHTETREHYCHLCRIAFKSRIVLNSHNKRLHGSSEARYECDYCQKKFLMKGDLRSHITWGHLRIGFRCTHCSKVLQSRSSCQKHIRFVHEKQLNPKNKLCEVCGKGFTTEATLRRHRHIHTGARPYKCDVCEATFTQNSTRNTHYQLVHLKIKKKPQIRKKTDKIGFKKNG